MIKKILVIDDEKDVVELIKARLEANKYEVFTAFSGKDGLEKTKTYQPNLILLDIMMPEMDGFEVLRRLKDMRLKKEIKNIPVVMLTAKGEVSSMSRARELGSVDYFVKPFDSEELLRYIRRYS